MCYLRCEVMPSQALNTLRRWAAALCTGGPLRLLVFAALLATLMRVTLRRLVDGDEGYLLMAARLVAQSHRPYVDFFCPQMPGFPCVFGAWGTKATLTARPILR